MKIKILGTCCAKCHRLEQTTREVVKELGIDAEIMVEEVRGAKWIVALDGCQVACAKKTIEHAGLKVTDGICVTDEDISISHNLLLEEAEIEYIT